MLSTINLSWSQQELNLKLHGEKAAFVFYNVAQGQLLPK